MEPKDKIIIGVDPGTTVFGYGVIKIIANEYELLSMGVVQLRKLDNHFQKLNMIFNKVSKLIDQYNPDEMAIEAPFYGKNVQSMLKLGRAQGISIVAAMQKNVPVFEYAPKKIKQSITGNGNASKEQVAGMLNYMIKYDRSPKFYDATDALATALCHHIKSSSPGFEKGENFNSWGEFIKKNPDRAKG